MIILILIVVIMITSEINRYLNKQGRLLLEPLQPGGEDVQGPVRGLAGSTIIAIAIINNIYYYSNSYY